MSESNKLPPSWAEATIDDLLKPLSDGRILHHGWSPQCESEPSISDDDWGVLKTTAIQDGLYLEEHNKRLPDVLTPRRNLEVQTGDILITCAGPRNRCGVPCLVRFTRPRLILSGKMYRFRVQEKAMDASFMEAFLRSKDAQVAIDGMKTGISDSGLNLTHGRFFQLKVPVAPLQEQHRIVAKIEELFSDLDAGVAALKRAKANLKRYRASVLKAAVEGKLTEQWRAKHPAKEPASALLARILKERRLKWEADQLAKFAAAKKEPPKNWRDKYVEPTPPDTECVPELPEGWTVATVDQLMATITSGSRDWTQYYGSGTGTFIMAQNVRKGLLDLAYRQEVNPPPYDRDRIRSQVVCNDLLVTIVGANTGDVCRVAIELPEHYVCQSVALMRPVVASVAKYLEAYFIADHGGQKYFRGYIYGQGRPHLGFDDLRNTPVVLPPLHEQGQMIAEVEQHLSIIDAAEKQIEHGLLRAARLRQSILKRAFEGKLVPQDPKDEPASGLLERMRASRSVHEGNSKPVTQPRVRRAKHQPNGEAS